MKKVKRKRIGRRILSFVLSLVLTLGLLPEMPGVKLVVQAAEGITITIDTGASVTIKDADGDGYYDIGTADELYAFAAAVNSGNRGIYGELTADIVVNESLGDKSRVWTPIGDDSNCYEGTFDGGGHTVKGLYFDKNQSSLVGFFGASKGMIKNVGVTESFFSGQIAAGICVDNEGTVTACYYDGSASGLISTGGICGTNKGIIKDCYSKGSMIGEAFNTYWVGGICGANTGTITDCYSMCSFTGKIQSCGAICATNNKTIENCYYSGNQETDSLDGTTCKTEEAFRSGEVCWLLNNSTASEDSVWGQNIGVDNWPVLGGTAVYSHTFKDYTIYSNGKDAATKVGDVYEIDSAEELRWFADVVNKYDATISAKLTADIDMNGVSWTQMESFSGTFDGDGHTISGLNGHIDLWSNSNIHGFIRTLSADGVVKNVTFTEAKVFNHEGSGAISGVIAYTNEGMVENCVVKNSMIHHGGYDALGVVVGVNVGTIRNCASISNTMTRRYSSEKAVCGFVWSNDGSIENCYTYECTYQNGTNHYAFTQSNSGTITNCYYYESSETLSDTAVTQKTVEQFAFGEVAYLLNGSKSTGTLAWYQTLSGNEPDAYPLLDSAHSMVYQVNKYDCPEDNQPEYIYSNTNEEIRGTKHKYENGKCIGCEAELDLCITPDGGSTFAEGEYTFANNVHTINTDRAVTITGTTTTETVVVASGVNANITLNGVSIDVSACAFKIADNSTGNVTITLADGSTNTLKSGENCAGLHKNGEYISDTQGKLTIQGGTKGTGKLTATGGYYGAGIGGGEDGAGTNITISGGTVTATGGMFGAGIGGGKYGAGTNITISGGTVTATGGKYGAGIGGGIRGVGSGITISGGTVTATGGMFGAGIGGGDYGAGTNITISGGSVKAIAGNNANAIGGGNGQSATTPTLADQTTPVYLIEIDNAESKNIVINDKDYPDAHGTEKKIYAYLPAQSEANPNVIKVGEAIARYYYETKSGSWIKTCGSGNHIDDNKDCACDNCAYTYGHTDNNDDGHCDTCNRIWIPAVDSNGDGVYEIGNANQLCWFAEYVNAGNRAANAELTADIDMTGVTWTTICETGLYYNSYGDDLGYSGTFDGKGHVISNLTVGSSKEGDASVGLFGTVSGTIKNLGMKGFILVDNGYDMRVGAIVGQLIKETGKVSNCYVDGATLNTNNRVAGGIAGCVYEGTVENCYVVNATVDGARYGYVAGDVRADGSNTDRAGFIKNCYTDKDALTSSYYVEGNLSDNRINVSEETFKSGEIAYLLNESTSGGTTWYQNLSDNEPDTYPVLNSARGTVYYGYNACQAVYTNDGEDLKEVGEHSWTDGKCTVCEKECSHSWNGDTCTICGFQYVKDITIKLADETAFGEGEYTFDHDTKVHTINTTKNVTISGTTTKETIVVAKNVSANITLAGVTIDVSDTDNACALKIEGDGTGTVTITLADQTTNTLESGKYCAGLQIEKVSGYENQRKLIIEGTGELDATSDGNGAGIGGGDYGDAGSITINSGTINATGGWGGAGIGGGFQGAGGSITINGGTIKATGGSDGAGIGGGYDETGGSITINGGTIKATSNKYGAGIGGGSSGDGGSITINGGTIEATSNYSGAGIGGGYNGTGGSITINGGNVKAASLYGDPVKGTIQNAAGEPLYLHTITLNGITEQTAITAIAADAEYGLEDVKTLDTNKLYVYLPFASMPYEVDAGGNCYYGKLTGDVEKEGTFYKVSFEKNSDTEMTGTGEEISTVISIAVPSDNKYTGDAIEAVVTDNYNENAQGMVQYEALEGTLTPVVVTMAPAPTPTPEPQVSFAPEPSVEPSSKPEVTDEPSGSSAPSGSSTPVRLSAALPATSWEPAPAPIEIPVTKNMPVNKGTYKASITLDGKTISVTYDIVARTLQASDFTFTAPEGAVYDGNTHQAAVESALEGMGEITIAYYDEAGNPVNGIPVDAGTYTVKISVSEGENCNAAENLTDDTWTFTIEKKPITITAENKSICVNCEEPAFTYRVDGLLAGDELTTDPVMNSDADMTATGEYAITPSAADAGSNYSITYVPGTLTVTEHLNDVDDFKCDVCGAIVDGVDLRGSNLTLNGNIGLNLFFEIDEEVKAEILADETAIIRFNLPDGSVTEVPAKEGVEDTTVVVGTTLYKYPCELTAKQMTDKVKVQFVTDGNVIAEYEYSIADYAAVIIANAEGKYSAESIALVKAMLNYGAYAQKNFGYNAENLANAQLAENEKSLSSVTVDTFETSRASGMIVDGLGTFAGSSLVLKSETTLKVYFEPAEGVTAEDLTFTVDGEEVTATTSGKYLVISITDIKAQELDKVFSVKVTDESHEGTFNACVFAYCYSVLSDTTGRFSDELKDVVKALYLYNMAADAYFN